MYSGRPFGSNVPPPCALSVGDTVGAMEVSTRRALVASGATKTSVARILSILHDAGNLHGDINGEHSDRSLKRGLTQASEDYGKSQTPYGKVVETMHLGVAGLEYWEYVNPFAYLYRFRVIYCAAVVAVAVVIK